MRCADWGHLFDWISRDEAEGGRISGAIRIGHAPRRRKTAYRNLQDKINALIGVKLPTNETYEFGHRNGDSKVYTIKVAKAHASRHLSYKHW